MGLGAPHGIGASVTMLTAERGIGGAFKGQEGGICPARGLTFR
jgi:hypothetical protein